MAKFAIIKDTSVITCIIADNKTTALSVFPSGLDAVEYTDANPAGLGYMYDPVTKTFTAPVKPEETPNA